MAGSVYSVAGDDTNTLCLGEMQSTRHKNLLHSALHILGIQVKDSFEEALEGSGILDKLADQLGRLVFEFGELVL